ncbi:hypothetical protein K523DRAFT_105436 [Schizophyllum commune Tattone D]|nr:hypothetical protein K523DRAFT_105436 [Schizophyllum commune Tattone D]
MQHMRTLSPHHPKHVDARSSGYQHAQDNPSTRACRFRNAAIIAREPLHLQPIFRPEDSESTSSRTMLVIAGHHVARQAASAACVDVQPFAVHFVHQLSTHLNDRILVTYSRNLLILRISYTHPFCVAIYPCRSLLPCRLSCLQVVVAPPGVGRREGLSSSHRIPFHHRAFRSRTVL